MTKRWLQLTLFALPLYLSAQDFPYEHTGVITDAPEIAGSIEVSNQTYQIDNNTQIHGLMKIGEIGPALSVGESVGFNYQLKDDKLYITDIWPMDNE